MTNKENALRIIRFDHPERVVDGVPARWINFHGCHHHGYTGGGHNCPVGSKWVDIWGTEWHKEHEGVMGFPRGWPLADPAALRTYQWPDPDDERICGNIYTGAKEHTNPDQFLLGVHRDTLWEKAYMIVGMENMMEYFYTEPNYAREILHRIMDFHVGVSKHYLKVGVEIVACSDDLGTQIAPLLNPDIVQEFFVPEYKRLLHMYRDKGVLINFHSCGHIEWAVPMFIELGVNILNPVQVTANNLDRLRALTHGKIALQGGVCSSTIMDGPVSRIEQEVRQRLWQLGRDGGYFCGMDQGLPFPEEHKAALKRAIEQYGRYPIQPVA